jgi:transposase
MPANDQEQLENYVAEGLSVEQIAERIGRHPATVTYWLKKHNLKPLGHDRHSPNGKVDPERLRRLIEDGATIREAAAELSVGYSTVRHWLKRLDLETETVRRRRDEKRARANGRLGVTRVCPKHGKRIFVVRSEGGYRCGKCRMAAVSNWRRRVKRRLVERAGGACELCGYDRYDGAAIPPCRRGVEEVRDQPERDDAILGGTMRRGRQVRAPVRELPRRGRGTHCRPVLTGSAAKVAGRLAFLGGSSGLT